MKKIPTLFQRDWDGDRSRVVNEINPEAAWLLDAEPGTVVCTVKLDGTACLVQDGILYARYMLREGKHAPAGFVAADEMKDGKQPGWRPVDDRDPADRYHREAFDGQPDGTYELVGPKIQGNPHRLDVHVLVPHVGGTGHDWVEPTWEIVVAVLTAEVVEGLVWQERGGVGRMVKVKRRDFGLPWPVRGGS